MPEGSGGGSVSKISLQLSTKSLKILPPKLKHALSLKLGLNSLLIASVS